MNRHVKCKICHITDNTGGEYPSDMDSDIHDGFTIGNGKQLYWEMVWHRSGHVTVYSINPNTKYGRYISGDTEITIHFKNKPHEQQKQQN